MSTIQYTTSTKLISTPVDNSETILNSDKYNLNDLEKSFSYLKFAHALSGSQKVASSDQISNDLLKIASREENRNLTDIEKLILKSKKPIVSTNESEEIKVIVEKDEEKNYKGRELFINEYLINEDKNPEIVYKKVDKKIEYIQELAIRYLRPETPASPGDIVIKQEANRIGSPAPPLIIRQQPARPSTPEPLIIREAPPEPPKPMGKKIITISGKQLPPPPRKVIIERLAKLPSKPQPIIVERWLPYAKIKRRVIFQKEPQPDPVVVKPRNVIVQWEPPQVVVRKNFKYLGVIRANPAEYVKRFGASLKTAEELPEFVRDIKAPDGLVLAADGKNSFMYELEGELDALRLVDLDTEGLSEYKTQLSMLPTFNNKNEQISLDLSEVSSDDLTSNSSYSTVLTPSQNRINQIFSEMDFKNDGLISVNEAESIFYKLNSYLGRKSEKDETVKEFFDDLDKNSDGSINISKFKFAFQRLL